MDVNLGWVSREEGDSRTAASLFRTALRTSRRHGDRSGTAYALLGVACVAIDQDDWRRGAVLLGHAEAYRDLSGAPWLSPEVHYRQLCVDRARAQLGDDEFEGAFAEGRRPLRQRRPWISRCTNRQRALSVGSRDTAQLGRSRLANEGCVPRLHGSPD